MKRGPSQVLFPKRTSPSVDLLDEHIGILTEWAYLLRLTVEPSARSSVKPSPPGTVKPLILTVVQLEALEASLIELMVTVQSSARFFGAADT